MTESNPKRAVDPWNRVTWLLLISTLLLGQLCIFWASYHISPHTELAGQIGMASTLLSIVLAIVAIVYSIYQGEAQNATSANIALALGQLTGTTSQLRTEVLTLGGTATQLESNRAQVEDSVTMLRDLVPVIQALHVTTGETMRSIERMDAKVDKLASKEATVVSPTSAKLTITRTTPAATPTNQRHSPSFPPLWLAHRPNFTLGVWTMLRYISYLSGTDDGIAEAQKLMALTTTGQEKWSFGMGLDMGLLYAVLDILEEMEALERPTRNNWTLHADTKELIDNWISEGFPDGSEVNQRMARVSKSIATYEEQQGK